MWCEGGRCVFFFNDTATTEIYTLSLHDALPILPDDDLAGLDDLAAEALHAEALGVRVATVAGRRCALLVCHVEVSPSRCRGPRRWSGADGVPAACGSRSCS